MVLGQLRDAFEKARSVGVVEHFRAQVNGSPEQAALNLADERFACVQRSAALHVTALWSKLEATCP
jgi:hypothetical protein